MRKLQKHDYADSHRDKDEVPREALARSGSGVVFDDDFVGALAQRLVLCMQTDLADRSRIEYDRMVATQRLLLSVFSLLAFIAVIIIVLKMAMLAWWIALAILGITGVVFVWINMAFQLPRR